eukprot:2625614-Rhodomonas_salina.5
MVAGARRQTLELKALPPELERNGPEVVAVGLGRTRWISCPGQAPLSWRDASGQDGNELRLPVPMRHG